MQPTLTTQQSNFKATADKEEKRKLHCNLITVVKKHLHIIVNMNRVKCTVI